MRRYSSARLGSGIMTASTSVSVSAQAPAGDSRRMVELIGSWTMVERRGAADSDRSGAGAGNFTGFPLNAAGKQKALTWNSTIQAIPEHQSRPHAAIVLDARARTELAHRRDHRSRSAAG